MEQVVLVLYALVGTVLASVLACVPALHIYNVAGLVFLLLARSDTAISPQGTSMLALGMVVGYAVANGLSSLFLSVPDESTMWLVLPGQQYLASGRGYEAAVLSAIGCLGGILGLLLLAPWASPAITAFEHLVGPHLHWLLALIAVYVLVSEWPKGTGRSRSPLARLWEGWKTPLAGLATFVLSGLLGILLVYRPIIPPDFSSLGLMPAFVGLFAVPWLLEVLVSRAGVPPQHLCTSLDVTPVQIATGTAAGLVGGLIAVLFPAITVGIGSLLAGHATAQRNEQTFIISQGASKAAYYIGAMLFWYVPGLDTVRGGMAGMVSAFYVPQTPQEYRLAVAVAALCGALSLMLFLRLARVFAQFIGRIPYRWLSLGVLLMLGIMIGLTTRWQGLLVALTAAGIGTIPMVFGSRRLNCMGILVVPMLLRLAGVGSTVARWLTFV